MNIGNWFAPPQPSSPGEAALQQTQSAAGGGGGDKKDGGGGGYEGSGFDPTGLERAARAAKVLNASPHAKNALSVIQEQERSKQMEYALQQTQYETYKAKLALEKIGEKYREDTQYLKRQTEEQKKLAEHSNEMERRRELEKLRAQEQLHKKHAAEQLALFERQEEMRRKTIEKEAVLRQETEMKKVDAEVAGRIRQEQENHDLHIEAAKVKGAEERQTVLESVKLASETIGAGIKDFLGDKNKMFAAASTITMVALGVYSAKVGTSLAGRIVEARLGKPSLVRETSRVSLKSFKHPIQLAKTMFGSHSAEDALSGVVLEPTLEQRLSRVAASTANTKRNKAPFRHLLLYGPPGTGKTLFAKKLAIHSGLEYAILTGGDVAPLGRDAVTEIHKVFDWATTSRKGLLLFIDESDAFLRKRSASGMSEDLRNALNAFLYRTGEPTSKFMVVYASNQPEQFDWAINDRIDELVEFGLPGLEERCRMLDMYVEKYLRGQFGRATKIIVDEGVNEALLREVAERIEGFSGREITKLAIAWQAAAYGSPDARLTPELLHLVLDAHIDQKKRKELWNTPAPGLAYKK